ncbi:four-carbon acid sugar kinase family protein (plasmid) [Cupriavidus pinatubonensis]|uniref:3-oxo-tetronate kinase n=1 Tax=Cupriavidus pinatubonensis TaxID=248026 RepID=UPI001C72BDB1|nr:3-oxo-tetronate kinase [Cupriavidus pinatubonensis]QYY33862.1 four-carbon acid sugar kinase family protein [Cupriavidus pinatubonensis]
MSKPLLGCVADDFTGGTDLASMLVKSGMRTIQTIGVPQSTVLDADAIVVALKTRTLPVRDAVTESLEALRWLQRVGCRQFYFKYCSTFDSTPVGNIGPVIDAMMEELGTDFTIVCPAFPENGRTVYNGYLFVGDVLLSESGMRNHPLTPMTDSNLVRVLAPQTKQQVGLVARSVVAEGRDAIRAGFDRCKEKGQQIAIVDAIENEDLYRIDEAVADLPLLTGGSGLAIGLADNFRRTGALSVSTDAAKLDPSSGRMVLLSGSCSVATNAQVEHWLTDHPGFKINPLAIHRAEDLASSAVEWVMQHDEPVLVYASAKPDEVAQVQQQLGVEAAGQLVEAVLSAIAAGLRERGFKKFIVAGGETSGAVVKALNVKGLRIGASIAPGVPWTQSLDGEPIALALKSGNFGTVSFFEEAMRQCP